jgi:uncharacterized repeat protein (TIGR01451 family)
MLKFLPLFLFVATTVSAQTSAILAPIALAPDHGYTEPALESTAWIVIPAAEEGELPTLVPVGERSVVPGQVILYEIAVVNPTAEPIADIVLNSAFPEGLRLQDVSIQGPEGMEVHYSVAADEAAFYPIYPLPVEEVRQAQPSTDTIAVFRVTVPAVPANSKILVTYAGQVRQGQPTLDETQKIQ